MFPPAGCALSSSPAIVLCVLGLWPPWERLHTLGLMGERPHVNCYLTIATKADQLVGASQPCQNNAARRACCSSSVPWEGRAQRRQSVHARMPRPCAMMLHQLVRSPVIHARYEPFLPDSLLVPAMTRQSIKTIRGCFGSLRASRQSATFFRSPLLTLEACSCLRHHL